MTEVLIAVSDGAQVRSYYRGADGGLTQVAQFLTTAVVDPAELATIVADLGDRLGWSGVPPSVDHPTRKLPAARPPERRVAASAKPVKPAKVKGKLGRPRRDGEPNMSWGYTKAAVLDTLRRIGPSFGHEMVAAFGHDPKDNRATQAMNTALQTLYQANLIAREVVPAYSAGNPSGWRRTRYTAVELPSSNGHTP